MEAGMQRKHYGCYVEDAATAAKDADKVGL